MKIHSNTRPKDAPNKILLADVPINIVNRVHTCTKEGRIVDLITSDSQIKT